MAVSRINEAGLNINQYGNRNIIINGAMQIAQRATQSTNASSTGYKTLDRYYHEMKVNTDQFTYTTEQVSDAPSGFSKSFKLTCTTAETALASDEYGRIYQAIEGHNLERIGFGTSDAKQTTLSFYVKSSLTGNFSASFYVNDANVIYSKAYTINAANTWERKTLTFPAYTTAGPNIDNTQGAIINFGLFAGSDSNTASTNWATYAQANLLGGQTASLAGTLNATWQITGIQLEVGDTATDFEHRTFADELARCQRYYEKSFSQGTAPAIGVSGDGANNDIGSISYTADNVRTPSVRYSVAKRAAATVTQYHPGGYGTHGTNNKPAVYIGGAWTSPSAVYVQSQESFFFMDITITGASAGSGYLTSLGWTADAEL